MVDSISINSGLAKRHLITIKMLSNVENPINATAAYNNLIVSLL